MTRTILCKRCEEEKSEEEFYRNQGKCKKCLAAIAKERYHKDNSKKRGYHRQYYLKNKEKIKAYSKQYKKDNPDKKRQHKRNYRKNNIGERLRRSQSKMIKKTLGKSGASKCGSTSKYLGCDPATLKNHLETQFQPGMNWENRGTYGWHIDHIRPLASFDLTKEEEQLKAFHYTNLQPLWWYDNIAKGDKWDE